MTFKMHTNNKRNQLNNFAAENTNHHSQFMQSALCHHPTQPDEINTDF